MKTNIFSIDQKKLFNQGWVNIPKVVIENCIGLNEGPCGTLEAMLTILLHVNYSDRYYTIGNRKVECHRGESVRTFTDWAKMFGWSRGKTKRYFMWLESINYIRFINDPYCLSHIVVLTYDEFVQGPKHGSFPHPFVNEDLKNFKTNFNINPQTFNRKTTGASASAERKGVNYKNKICESEDYQGESSTNENCMNRNCEGKICMNGSSESKICMNDNCKCRSCENGNCECVNCESKICENGNCKCGNCKCGNSESEDYRDESCVNESSVEEFCENGSCINGSSEEEICENESCMNGSSEEEICTSENKAGKTGKNHSNNYFELHAQFLNFWDAYYEVVQLPRKNIGKAEKEWNRLSEEERELAVENISNYYYSLTDTRYLLQPANYLANKAFLDEFTVDYN